MAYGGKDELLPPSVNGVLQVDREISIAWDSGEGGNTWRLWGAGSGQKGSLSESRGVGCVTKRRVLEMCLLASWGAPAFYCLPPASVPRLTQLSLHGRPCVWGSGGSLCFPGCLFYLWPLVFFYHLLIWECVTKTFFIGEMNIHYGKDTSLI